MVGCLFGWLNVWVLSPDWLCRKLKCVTLVRHINEATTPKRVLFVPGLNIILYSRICLTTEEKLRITLRHGTRKVLGLLVPTPIRLVYLAVI
jgi:hypothetical protein